MKQPSGDHDLSDLTPKRRKNHVVLTAARKKRVLELLRDGEFVVDIADAVGVRRQTLYHAKGRDKDFSDAWDEAAAVGEQIQVALIEQEMDFRSRIGWLEPKFYEGRVCGFIRRYSDALLLARAKALAPNKYGDKAKIDTTVNENRSIKIEFVDVDEDT